MKLRFITPIFYIYLHGVMECYILTLSKYSITRKHSVTARNRYVFRYRKLAKEINTLIDCFCLKTKQHIQFSNIEAFSFPRTKGFFFSWILLRIFPFCKLTLNIHFAGQDILIQFQNIFINHILDKF